MTPPLKGFAFPFAIDPATGGVQTLTGADKLRANIVHIVLTNVGERMMRRGYGGGVRPLLQDPNDQVMWTLVKHQIGKTIAQTEPRVLIRDVSFSRADDATVLISVTYIERRAQTLQSLSIPVNFVGASP